MNKYLVFLKNQKVKFGILIFLTILILCNFVFFIGKNSVDLPVWDQWSLADDITDKTNLTEMVFYQHNEHKMGLGFMIMKGLAQKTNWSQIAEIKLVMFVFLLALSLVTFLKYRVSKKIDYLDIFIPFLVLNLFQYENLVQGFQLAFILPFFFLILSLHVMRMKNIITRNIILSVISLLSVNSHMHGLFIPIVIIGFLAYERMILNKGTWKIFIISIIAKVLIIGSYFINFEKNYQAELLTTPKILAVKYFSILVSSGFLFTKINPLINYSLLFITLGFFSYGIYRLVKEKKKGFTLIGALLISYSFLFLLSILIGRFALGEAHTLVSRYITYSMLIPLGLFFIFSDMKRGNILKLALLFFLISNTCIYQEKSLKFAEKLTRGKIEILECYKNTTFEKYPKCAKKFSIFPDSNYLNSKVPQVMEYKGIEFKKKTK